MAICLTITLIIFLCRHCFGCLNFEAEKNVCYSSEKNQNQRELYGTKTTYTLGKKAFEEKYLKKDWDKIGSDCQPIMFYYIARHGIRYPDKDDIQLISEKLVELQKQILEAAKRNETQLCNDDIEAFRNWKLQMKPSDDNNLSETGVYVTKQIGKQILFCMFQFNYFIHYFCLNSKTIETTLS